jgi:glycosyltransferase involved in cell wall biosynthesis
MNNLVSVIVLTFNSERYIQRCLDSLVNQTHNSLEVLIIDAGSTDLTELMVNSYIEKLSIRFISAPNTNMGQARNIGIQESRGDFLAFCDSDDYYLNEKISLGVKKLNKNQHADVSYGDALHFNSDDHGRFYLARRMKPFDGNIATIIVKTQTININTLLIRRDRMGHVRFPNDCGGRYGEDWQYLINLVVAGAWFTFTKGRNSMIEVRSDSHTSWAIQHLMKWYVIRNIVLQRLGLQNQGVTEIQWHINLMLHWLKFCIACIVAKDYDYISRANYSELGGKPVVVKVFEFLSMPIANKTNINTILKYAWELNRKIKKITN